MEAGCEEMLFYATLPDNAESFVTYIAACALFTDIAR